MAPTAGSQPRLSRGRRAVRASGDEREAAILTTAAQLLEQGPLADISVDALAKGAGISRPTFYFYFPSKDAVLLTLFDRLVAEADTAMREVAAIASLDRNARWRRGIEVFFETFVSRNKGLTRACWDAIATNTEVRQLRSSAMQRWISFTAKVIDAERASGAAPHTDSSAEELATVLNLMNERVMAASLAPNQPRLPPARVVDTLADIWVTSIYGARSNVETRLEEWWVYCRPPACWLFQTR